MVFALPFYGALVSRSADLTLVCILAGLSAGFTNGSFAVLLTDLFPTRIRFTGVALIFNVSFTLFSGMAPLAATTLIRETGTPVSPAYLMMGIMALSGLLAIVGGAAYLLITVGSVFFGKKIANPGYRAVSVREGRAARPAPQPVAAAITGHGNIGIAGFVAPGTFTLAIVFLVAFVLYYFVNWKYLSTVWPLS